MTPGLTESERNAIRDALDNWHDDPNGVAKAMFIADLVTRHRDALLTITPRTTVVCVECDGTGLQRAGLMGVNPCDGCSGSGIAEEFA